MSDTTTASDTPITGAPLIGIDLDACLAFYDGWKGPTHIGEPILRMSLTLFQHLAQGHRICIFTARVNPEHDDWKLSEQTIKAWCLKHFGREFPVTCMKSHEMVMYYDDRAVGIIPNTGRRADGKDGDVSLPEQL